MRKEALLLSVLNVILGMFQALIIPVLFHSFNYLIFGFSALAIATIMASVATFSLMVLTDSVGIKATYALFLGFYYLAAIFTTVITVVSA